MRKKFISLTIISLIMVLVLTGCTKTNGEDPNNKSTFRLEDTDFGTVTMEYSNDAGFVFVKNSEYAEYTLTCQNQNFEADIYLNDTYETYEEAKQDRQSYEGYAEYTFNGFKAYTYSQNDPSVDLRAFIFVKDGNADQNSIFFYMDFSKYDSEKETNLQEVFNSPQVKSMLDTITYTAKV